MRTYTARKLIFTVEDLDDGRVRTSLTTEPDANRVSTSMSMTMPPELDEVDADRCAALALIYVLGLSGGNRHTAEVVAAAVSGSVSAQEGDKSASNAGD